MTWKSPGSTLVVIVGLLIATVSAAGCESRPRFTFTPTPSYPTELAAIYARDFGGSIVEYRRILGSMNCQELQREFDQATARSSGLSEEARSAMGYAEAASLRRNALRCQ